MGGKPYIVVVDPAVHTPELDSFNNIAFLAPLPLTYHLPALLGLETLPGQTEGVRGVIVMGSAASVHDHLPWQRPLEQWLRPLCDRGVPVLGLCYGHQMLAHMFGGKIEYMNEARTKLRGVREVTLNIPDLNACSVKPLIVTHNEHVTRVPDGFDVVATSPQVAVDGIKHRKLPIFGFQSHPEATTEFLKAREMLEPHAVSALPGGHELVAAFLHLVKVARP